MVDPNRSASFLVRIWWEPRADPCDPPVWRGRVEHIPSGRVAHFDEVGVFLAFVERWTGELSTGSAATARTVPGGGPLPGTDGG